MMSMSGKIPSLVALSLLLSLLTKVALSAPTLSHHSFEWKTLHTAERGTHPKQKHLSSWKQEFNAIASTRGRKLYNNSRSLQVSSNFSTTEVNALLSLKSSVQDPTGALANWTMENHATHCSSWKGVYCDEIGQVSGIDLGDLGLNGTITPMIGNLVHLTWLTLSANSMWGPIPWQLMRCQKLYAVDLSYNALDGELLPELLSLPFLEWVNLSQNRFSGPLPEVGENACGSLTHLLMDVNYISGAIPSSLSRCHRLKVLSLSDNQFNGSIPASLGELHQLQALYLHNNTLTGSIPASLGNCSSLIFLHLSRNALTGSIPKELGELDKLVELGLDLNGLDGEIPSSFGTLSQLQELWLDGNQLTGPIPPSLGNLTSLIALWLGYNKLTGTIPEELGNLSSVIHISLRDNLLTGSIPGSLSRCSKLQVLWVGACNFTSIAPEIWTIQTMLDLSLLNNSLSGEIPFGLGNLSQLEYLDLSHNAFVGKIPRFLGNFSNLLNLDLSNNKLSDDAVVLSTLGQCSKLEVLSLGHNDIYGYLKLDFTKWANLQYFSVMNNKLTGEIPPSFGSANSSLILVDFSHNNFTGRLPMNIDGTFFSSLRVLIFSYNQFDGEIPSWFGNLKRLQVLDLSFNKFIGSIPQNFGDLDGYKVQPNDSDSATLFTFNQSILLTTKGEMSTSTKYYYILETTTYMDVSSNSLEGEIPLGITNLVGLKYLILSINKLDGIIWTAFKNLEALETLDLSQNNLSGPIPPMLSSSLSTFNVSFNNLSGAIPTGGQFDTFTSVSSYLPGNLGLCGQIIQRSCTHNQANPPMDPLDSINVGITNYISIAGFEIGAVGGFLIVVVTLLVWSPARHFIFRVESNQKIIAMIMKPGYGFFNPIELGWFS